jgi:hypothetical protein
MAIIERMFPQIPVVLRSDLQHSGDLVLRGGDKEKARKREGNVRKVAEEDERNRNSGTKE